MNLISALFITLVLFTCIVFKNNLGLSTGSLGLLLSYVLQLAGSLQWVVRQSAEVDNMILSAERIIEFSKLPNESGEGQTNPQSNWPVNGHISFKNMSLLCGNKNVLKNISFEIQPGTKVALVGRTGAGKSSLIQALFRLYEPFPKNCILIDGISTSEIAIKELRDSITIIPQEPICFEGTIRFNLDPNVKYHDEKLWNVLELVTLKDQISSLPKRLDEQLGSKSEIWSAGQKQLFSLARAILKESKIIVMDEPTSSVDYLTDKLFRQIVSPDGLFADRTVINIAHRLNTILDYDCVVVLEEGNLVEIGNPKVLLEKDPAEPDAWFKRMMIEL